MHSLFCFYCENSFAVSRDFYQKLVKKPLKIQKVADPCASATGVAIDN